MMKAVRSVSSSSALTISYFVHPGQVTDPGGTLPTSHTNSTGHCNCLLNYYKNAVLLYNKSGGAAYLMFIAQNHMGVLLRLL